MYPCFAEAAGRRTQRRSSVIATLLALVLSAVAASAFADSNLALPAVRLTADLLEPQHLTWPEMLEQRRIRALVSYNRTQFFFDGPRARGITADALVELEKHLNKTLDVGSRKIKVIAVPVARDQLIPFLEQGRGDIAVANLTITEARARRVDFTVPTMRAVSEVLVSGPGAPVIARAEDLAGEEIYVRRSSSFWDSVTKLNQTLKDKGSEPVRLHAADEAYETEDILEMVNAGVVKFTVVDSHIAEFWARIFKKLKVHSDIELAHDRNIAWAVRKQADGLKTLLDPLIKRNRQGRMLGNMLLRRYLAQNRWITNPTAGAEAKRMQSVMPLFERYGRKFNIDPLMLAAQAYQESGLNQSVRSRAGAVGIMQILPSTAKDPSVNVSGIDRLEPNIHAGSKYLRYLMDKYFNDKEMAPEQRVLFALAAYNAGPSRINRLRRETARQGLDPNQWFGHVERIAARKVGREPVQYVANIHKYYVAYRLAAGQEEKRKAVNPPR